MTLPITQRDREMAAELYENRREGRIAASFRSGDFDHWKIVQTIARARIGGWNEAVEKAAQAAKDTGHAVSAYWRIRDLGIDHQPPGALPQDVITLVIAAREAWEEHGSSGDDLDNALEPFASRVPYENDPEEERAHFDQEWKNDE